MKSKVLFFFTLYLLSACSIDFKQFDESHYADLTAIEFYDQAETPLIVKTDNTIKLKLLSNTKNKKTLKLKSFEISPFAALYLIDTLLDEHLDILKSSDSIQNLVSNSLTKLEKNSSIELLSDSYFYLAVMAENKKTVFWKVNISYLQAVQSSSSSSNPLINSSSSSLMGSSSSSHLNSSSSSNIKSSSSSESIQTDPSIPQILALKINEMEATIHSNTIVIDDLPFLTDLTQLKVSDVLYSDSEMIETIPESVYDLRKEILFYLKTQDTTVEYTLKAGYQYPNSNFNDWIDSKNIEAWDNGNNSLVTITEKFEENGVTGVKMTSKKVLTTFASGNLFTGVFNPKNVGLLSMASYKNGNELIDFGFPFAARPEYIEVDFQYDGKGDSCDIYIVLENRSAKENKGSNQYRSPDDINILVASAWFRASSDTDDSDPDVVSIQEKDNGFKTLRMRLKYGKPYDESPIYQSKIFDSTLSNANGIDNSLIEGSGEEEVTHLRIALASSSKGDTYQGVEGAVLWVDALRLLY